MVIILHYISSNYSFDQGHIFIIQHSFTKFFPKLAYFCFPHLVNSVMNEGSDELPCISPTKLGR